MVTDENKERVLTGLEQFMKEPQAYVAADEKVALLANPTAIDAQFRHAVELFWQHPLINLTLLLGPEHGIRGDAQDMVSVDGDKDPQTGLPEVSLYGADEASLAPKPEVLKQIDVLVYDVHDVGARYYTYQATMALCMRACAAQNKRVIVLDRPNPIGLEQVEGGGIEPGLENFCGIYPIPQRHGLTVGEMAKLYNEYFEIGCELTVVPCKNYSPSSYFDETRLPWVMPSPNMPTLETAIVYPGMCLLEGTNLSEGRGTTRPFELSGAPYLDAQALATILMELGLPGVVFRPTVFYPMFQKHAKQQCGGVQLHVTSRQQFNALKTGVAFLWAAKKLAPNEFGWRQEPYEFRKDVPAIDLLAGTKQFRHAFEKGAGVEELYGLLCDGAEVYWQARKSIRLYA